MRSRLILALLCSIVALSAVSGCSSKQSDAKEQAAKIDRSKIDDEVNQSQTSGNNSQQSTTGQPGK